MTPLRATTGTPLREPSHPESRPLREGLAPYRGQPVPVVVKDNWIPKAMQLPDSIEAIEAGRPPQQQQLFPKQPDDSRAGRLTRILADVPGVATADNMKM